METATRLPWCACRSSSQWTCRSQNPPRNADPWRPLKTSVEWHWQVFADLPVLALPWAAVLQRVAELTWLLQLDPPSVNLERPAGAQLQPTQSYRAGSGSMHYPSNETQSSHYHHQLPPAGASNHQAVTFTVRPMAWPWKLVVGGGALTRATAASSESPSFFMSLPPRVACVASTGVALGAGGTGALVAEPIDIASFRRVKVDLIYRG